MVTEEKPLPHLYDVCDKVSKVIFVDTLKSSDSDFIDYELTKDDVVRLLEETKSCENVVLLSKKHHITEEDLKVILNGFTIDDFVQGRITNNQTLLRFTTDKEFYLSNDTFFGIDVDMSLCLISMTKNIIVYVFLREREFKRCYPDFVFSY